MKTSTPCPNCNKSLTIEHFEDFPSPFNMKCPHCKAKLKETKMTPILILVAIIIIPLFILLGVTVKNILTNFFPVVEKSPQQ